jgi:hypothetical protein
MISMILPQETIGGNTATCTGDAPFPHNLKVLHLQVCGSAASGYYIGFICPQCGSYSRESEYFRTYEQAEKALKSGTFC